MKLYTLIIFCSLVDKSIGISDWDVFATKTTYHWATGRTINPFFADVDYSFLKGNYECKAVHVNMVLRHGARWPTDSNMEHIEELANKIKENKTSSLFTELDNWANRYDLQNDGKLVQEGMVEQEFIGRNTWMRFQTLFEMYGNKYVKFVSSSKGRCIQSTQSFYNGFYKTMDNKPIFAYEKNNKLMRFYDDCDRYETDVEDNEENFKELRTFEKSRDFQNVIKSVEGRLGLDAGTLSVDDVYQIHNLCSYEKYIYNETTWCNLLTDEERQVMEYSSDLENYYESSYGHPFNAKIACPLLDNMLTTMEISGDKSRDFDSIPQDNANGYLAAKIYEGHSGTMLPLMTKLGLFNDSEPLKSSNREKMKNRKFRTSHITPFSSNIAFVVYSCDDKLSSNHDREMMVKLFVNELPVTIPACNNEVCTLQSVLDYFKDIRGDKCDLEKLCEIKPVSEASRHIPVTFLYLIVLLLISYISFK
ncbi:PHOsphatase [Mactra antiquata]